MSRSELNLLVPRELQEEIRKTDFALVRGKNLSIGFCNQLIHYSILNNYGRHVHKLHQRVLLGCSNGPKCIDYFFSCKAQQG